MVNRLEASGYLVASTDHAAGVRQALDSQPLDLVVFNESVNDLTPFQLLDELHNRNHDAFAVVTSVEPELKRGMEWILAGAFAYVELPAELDFLQQVIYSGLANQEAYHQVVSMAAELKHANLALEKEKSSLDEKTRELRFLYDLGSQLSATLDAREIVRIVFQEISSLVHANLVTLFTAFSPGSPPRLHSSRPLTRQLSNLLADDMRLQLGPRLASAQSGHHSMEPKTKKARPLVSQPKHRIYLPLIAAGRHCGLMGVYFFHPPAFDQDRLMILKNVALQAAQSLFNAYQHEKALDLASHDPLTGLYNRRAFDGFMEREFDRHRRYQTDLSLIMLDLDHFKSVNDRFGHKAGDQVLETVAGIIKSAVRSTDIAARLGGEEFGVILPNTKQNESLRLARRIQDRLRQTTLRFGEVNLRQTVSQGVAGTETGGLKEPDDLVRIADRALYQAKREGRNTIRKAAVPSSEQERKDNVYVWNG
jgi:diguanylate cyclase (GGDEF)-like protein